MIFSQIFNTINEGIVILDKNLKVFKWNNWMSMHSGVSGEEIIGKTIHEFFPRLNAPWFLSNCKSIFNFGHFASGQRLPAGSRAADSAAYSRPADGTGPCTDLAAADTRLPDQHPTPHALAYSTHRHGDGHPAGRSRHLPARTRRR